MATTTKRTTTTNSNGAKVPNENIEKARDWIKAHSFVLYLAAVTFVALMTLQANGFRGVFVYDDALGIIVGIFNVAVMAYPAYLAIINRHTVRISIIAATVLLTFFVLPIVVRLLSGFGSALWEVPALGPIIFPIAALVLHALAAFMLAVYEPKGPDTAAEIKASIPGIEGNVTRAQEAFGLTSARGKASDKAETKAKAKFIREQEGSKKAADLYAKTTKAYDKSSGVKIETKLKQKLDEAKRRMDEVQVSLQAKERELEQAYTSSLRDHLNEQLEATTEAFNKLRDKHKQLEKKLAKASKAVKASPEKQAKDAALAASSVANKAKNRAKIGYEIAMKAALKASNKDATAGKALEKLEKQLDDAHARIAEAIQSQRSVWRDVAFWPILTFMLGFVLYSVWYGWVVVNFAAI